MNKVLILIWFILLNLQAFAQESAGNKEFYAGINPIAPFTGLPNQFTNLYLPLFSNIETGLAINAGMISKKHKPEVRFSIGKPNSLFLVWQLHGGYNLSIYSNNPNSIYVGGFVKYYHLTNSKTSVSYKSIIPYATFGYRYQKNKFFCDIRLNQNIYAVSWSSLNNTSVNNGFLFSIYDDISPVLPYLSINVGYVFIGNNGK